MQNLKNIITKGRKSCLKITFFLSITALFITNGTIHASEETDCSTFKSLDLSNLDDGHAATSITSSKFIRKGTKLNTRQINRTYRFSLMVGAPIKQGTSKLPAHCLVEGYVTPTIRFEIRLPLKSAWNKNYLMSSCDGFCGQIQQERTMAGVIRNYATMTHDGGHTNSGFDAKWAKNNIQGKIDFGHRANHVLALVAKAVIKEYYGKKPKFSIMTGCSKGGQAGIMAAQRYPEDYDGIIARGPTINYTKVNLINCMDNAKDNLDKDDKPIIDLSFAKFLQDSAMAACDETDGLKDGIISDPRACKFDPAELSCDKIKNGGKCLSAVQVTALKGLYAPSIDSKGNELYGGLPIGSEGEWQGWVMPFPGLKPFHYYAATEYMKYIAYPGSLPADYNWRDFNYETEKNRLGEISPHFDADNPDLREFRNRGGKIIVLHGWADAAIPAHASIRWYEDVMRFMGGAKETGKFARMFLLPGVNHCGTEGPGPSSFEALKALEKWMEEGKAPELLLTAKVEKGKIVRTRPVFPYPLGVKYKGTGDINKAKNFVSFDPK